jgi:ATP-dependent Clp protease ATP-binding subunit ClpA
VERTAVQLADDATRLGNPRKGLAAITELRRRLEELEAWHVDNAIRAGLSWSQIGAALSISKQAAHKKHAKSSRSTAKTSFAAARERGVVVTAEARRAVQHASREASALGHPALGTEHLLLGVLAEEHAASTALARAGVELEPIRAAVSGLRRGGNGNGASPEEHGRPPISEDARGALEQSLRESVERGDPHLGVEHVLLALLADEQGAAVRALEGIGAAPAVVRKELDAGSRRRGRNVRLGA